MRETSFPVVGTLPAALDELCRTFGIWRTTAGLVRAAWRHHRLVNQTTGLSNRMRRDIGLPEVRRTARRPLDRCVGITSVGPARF
ncbi:DUF1127 domain-containing protein [Ensifer canadensis]